MAQVNSLAEAIEESRAVVDWLLKTEHRRMDSAVEIANDMLQFSAAKYGERSTMDAAFASAALALATLLTVEEFSAALKGSTSHD